MARMAKVKASRSELLITAITLAVVAALLVYDAETYLVVGVVAGFGFLSFWLGRWFASRTPADKFHFFQLWKIPDPTTRGAIWLMAAYDGALLAIWNVVLIALLINLSSDGSLDMFRGLAATFGVWAMAVCTPASYWRYRRRYEPIAETGGLVLRYVGKSALTFREKCGVALAIVGGVVAWHIAMFAYLIWFIT